MVEKLQSWWRRMLPRSLFRRKSIAIQVHPRSQVESKAFLRKRERRGCRCRLLLLFLFLFILLLSTLKEAQMSIRTNAHRKWISCISTIPRDAFSISRWRNGRILILLKKLSGSSCYIPALQESDQIKMEYLCWCWPLLSLQSWLSSNVFTFSLWAMNCIPSCNPILTNETLLVARHSITNYMAYI